MTPATNTLCVLNGLPEWHKEGRRPLMSAQGGGEIQIIHDKEYKKIYSLI